MFLSKTQRPASWAVPSTPRQRPRHLRCGFSRGAQPVPLPPMSWGLAVGGEVFVGWKSCWFDVATGCFLLLDQLLDTLIWILKRLKLRSFNQNWSAWMLFGGITTEVDGCGFVVGRQSWCFTHRGIWMHIGQQVASWNGYVEETCKTMALVSTKEETPKTSLLLHKLVQTGPETQGLVVK